MLPEMGGQAQKGESFFGQHAGDTTHDINVIRGCCFDSCYHTCVRLTSDFCRRIVLISGLCIKISANAGHVWLVHTVLRSTRKIGPVLFPVTRKRRTENQFKNNFNILQICIYICLTSQILRSGCCKELHPLIQLSSISKRRLFSDIFGLLLLKQINPLCGINYPFFNKIKSGQRLVMKEDEPLRLSMLKLDKCSQITLPIFTNFWQLLHLWVIVSVS